MPVGEMAHSGKSFGKSAEVKSLNIKFPLGPMISK
jgi:hypothetical protein